MVTIIPKHFSVQARSGLSFISNQNRLKDWEQLTFGENVDWWGVRPTFELPCRPLNKYSYHTTPAADNKIINKQTKHSKYSLRERLDSGPSTII